MFKIILFLKQKQENDGFIQLKSTLKILINKNHR